MAVVDGEVPGFALIERIGGGSTGEVWRARDVATGETVAVKRLRSGAGSRAPAAESLTREAALLAAFRHPHVIVLRDVVQVPEGPVLVLDHAAGGSLADLLARHGRLTAAEVVTAISPIADALAAAHARGLVHGDISPGNLLLTADGRPLLADLGTARLLGELPGQAHGTHGYVDPALFAGAPPGKPQDVYALAAVAAHALTGAPLTPDGQVREWAAAAASVAPPAIVRAVSDALTADLGRRPDARAFAASLRAAAVAAPLPMSGPARARQAGSAGAMDPVTGVRPAARAAAPAAPRTHAVGRRPSPATDADADAGGRHRHALAAGRGRLLVRGSGAVLLLGLAVWGGVAWGAAARPDQPAAVAGNAQRARPADSARSASHSSPTSAAAKSAPPPSSPGTSQAPDPSVAERSTPRGDTDRTVPPQWRDIVAALDNRRVAAFSAADPALLGAVYAPGSPARAADAASIAVLRRAHAAAVGLRHDILAVTVRRRSNSVALVRVVDRMPSYEVVDDAGTVLERRRGRGRHATLMRLVRHGGGWRIAAVTPAVRGVRSPAPR